MITELTIAAKHDLEAKISSIYCLYSSFIDGMEPKNLNRMSDVLVLNIKETLEYHKFPKIISDRLTIKLDVDFCVYVGIGINWGSDIPKNTHRYAYSLLKFLNEIFNNLYQRIHNMRNNQDDTTPFE